MESESTGALPVPPGEFNQSAGRMPALPGGVSNELWQQLTTELETQLIATRNASRVDGKLLLRNVSTPPTRPLSKAVLSADSSELLWGYYSNGDYDQNGEVNISDLTPVAIHFKESVVPDKFPVGSVQAVIDGDDNGEINIADVTPIAINFKNTVAQYNLYRSQDADDFPDDPNADNGGAELLASLLPAEATGMPDETRLQFSFQIPDVLDEEYFWVRPEDNAATEGIASNMVGPLNNTYALNGHVFMAGGGSDPLPGVPVDLSGDETQSTVTDEFGHYSFSVLNGSYTVTPGGDPYGYAPLSVDAAIAGADKYLPPIYPAPVDIVHTWGLDDGEAMAQWSKGELVIDNNGDILVSSHVHGADEYRLYLLKYDMFGELVWSQVFNLPYGISGSKIFLSPIGEIFLAGTYQTVDGFDTDAHDLFVMKLDSTGGIIWEYSFNYPTTDLVDHFDTIPTGYFDLDGNLNIFSKSFGGPGNPCYMLVISPGGELLEQKHINPTSPAHSSVTISDLEFNPVMGLYACGRLDGSVDSENGFLVRIAHSGEVDLITNWGIPGASIYGIEVWLDGSIYLLGEHENEIQLAGFDSSGVRNWEILCTAEYDNYGIGQLQLGPQGKLWVAGFERNPDAINQEEFPFLWSFQPDSSRRFSHQWVVEGFDPWSRNPVTIDSLEINEFGVAVITGATIARTGEWVEHDIAVEDVSWDITHADSFTFETDDPAAEFRALPIDPSGEVGVVDPPPTEHTEKTYIMLYRP